MPELLDHIAFLSQQVGPRPAGTEEEQQAALYINDFLQKEAGLPAVVEDFDSESNDEAPKAICALFTLLITIPAVFFPILAIPALVITVITAVLYTLEVLDRPFILRRLARGVSQNVVARFDPGYTVASGSARRRKIVLVAHYDSGKVHPELSEPVLGLLPLLQKLAWYAMVFVPVFLLVRFFFFLYAEGAIAVVLNLITIIALICVALPIILVLMHKFSPYNEAANCNAAGVAALLEVARRVGRGTVAGQAEGAVRPPVVYGEEAARASGLVPEGAGLVYETPPQPPEWAPQTEEGRLAAAKDAIAALTGRPVARKAGSSVADNLVQVGGFAAAGAAGAMGPAGAVGGAFEGAAAAAGMPAGQTEGAGWAGQQQAMEGAYGQAAYGQAEYGQAAYDQTAYGQTEYSQVAYDQAAYVQAAGWAPESGASEAAGPNGPAGWGQPPAVAGQPWPEQTAQADGGAQAVGPDAGPDASGQGAVATDATPAEPSVPDWFRRAQEQAKRPKDSKATKVQRSLYADALDAALAENPSRFSKAGRTVDSETEDRLQRMREEIMEVAAPQIQHNGDGYEQAAAADGGENPLSDADATIAMPPIGAGAAPGAWQGGQESSAYPGYIGQGEAYRPSPIAAAIPALSGAEAGGRQQTASSVFPGTGAAQRGPIVLPDIDIPGGGQAARVETMKQRASIPDEGAFPSGKPQLNRLPTIETTAAGAPAGVPAAVRADLRSILPSISGPISDLRTAAAPTAKPSAGAEAPADAGRTENFAPAMVQAGAAAAGQAEYVDEAAYGESGTPAADGSDYMDMPKSHRPHLFGRRGSRKNKQDGEPIVDDDDWQGGAFSRKRPKAEEQPDDTYPSEAGYGEGYAGQAGYGQAYGGQAYADPAYAGQAGYAAAASQGYPADEMSQIYQFRNLGLDTEIWFVALGSELSGCGGMRAFLTEHGQDLRGAVFVNLRALGSGVLSYLEKEGTAAGDGASSRMLRYVKKAAENLGMGIEPASLVWMNSATTVAVKKGYQAVSIAGMQGSKPARFAQKDDTFDNIEEATLRRNVDFVVELLKNI